MADKRLKARVGGFTLIEVLMAMMVLYIACAYLMGLFSSEWRLGARNHEYTATTFLARSQMEHLASAPIELLGNKVSGRFAAPYEDYVWEAKISDFQAGLKLITLVVTSPRRAKTTLQRVRMCCAFMGVSCDGFTDQVIWNQPKSGVARLHQYSQGRTLNLNLSLPDTSNGFLGALCGVPGRGVVWGAGSHEPVIAYYAFDEDNRLRTTRYLRAPKRSGLSSPLFSGIAGDRWGNWLFCADVVNGGIWQAEDNGTKLAWTARSPLIPKQLPLNRPAGVVLDETASILWIAESGAGCLRPLYLRTDVQPSGEGVEKIPEVGWWGKRITSILVRGALHGVAVNPWASMVYTIDGHCLHTLRYTVDDNGIYKYVWSSRHLPASLIQDRPMGLACDPYNNVLYINTRQGQIWHMEQTDGHVFKEGL